MALKSKSTKVVSFNATYSSIFLQCSSTVQKNQCIFNIFSDVFVECMNTQVSHFEYLNYDIYNLQEQHERVRRSTSTRGKQPVNLEFASHGR